jgi:hypothetical protein
MVVSETLFPNEGYYQTTKAFQKGTLHQSDSIQCVGKRLVPYEYKNTEKP